MRTEVENLDAEMTEDQVNQTVLAIKKMNTGDVAGLAVACITTLGVRANDAVTIITAMSLLPRINSICEAIKNNEKKV